jgi:D-alanyl-D-alanine carboxypeptidase
LAALFFIIFIMKNNNHVKIIGGLVVAIIVLLGLTKFVDNKDNNQSASSTTTTTSSQQTTTSTSTSKTASSLSTTSSVSDKNFPKGVSSKDWDLVIVNRDHPHDEFDPTTSYVGTAEVDSRIATATQDFLTAAQSIVPGEHLISGYRSVVYQEQLFNSYVQQEMANKGLDEAAAENLVKTYSQPAKMSEHNTGLAIDMSDVDSLNESQYATRIAQIAPDYGFILRFPKGGKDSTGVDYEDWHFRYVGKANAKYITEHNLTLEQYVELLKKNGK